MIHNVHKVLIQSSFSVIPQIKVSNSLVNAGCLLVTNVCGTVMQLLLMVKNGSAAEKNL